MDDKKCIPKGAWYGCLLRGPVRALDIKRQMLAAKHWTGCGIPMEKLEGSPEELKRFTAP